ncbi:hypothetical protein SCLCIDRAFT_116127, partial [Scleroderma citrinum Foug A]
AGQPPNTIDERCFIYCTQTAPHRAQRKPPTCRSICLRRIFPFEIEVLEHDIPLPPEGQVCAPTPDQPHPPQPQEIRIWNPGFYIWTSSSARAARDKIETMTMDLSKQHVWSQKREEWSRSHLHLLSASSFSLIKSSILSPIQSLLEPVSTVLTPTSLALLHFRNALSNGSLHHLGARAWEKAWSPDPMILAMKVVKRVWKKEGGEDEGDNDGDVEG